MTYLAVFFTGFAFGGLLVAALIVLRRHDGP